ncbi:sensor histidine kinase [Carboxylicivirga sp. RSCT41]|uniref:sensor histidine kinase n=1 Tax=Carboxylicivirga agarovorans TaxID=3417570 RepID=UPI003D3262AB
MEKNPYLKKKTRIVLLMIVSQLLLSAFVGYWLVTQYKNEKQLLNRELRGHYYDVKNEMFDRLIYEAIITPIIENQDKSDLSGIQFKDIELTDEKKLELSQSIIEVLNENEQGLDKLFEYYTSVYPRTRPDDRTRNLIFTIQNYIFQAGIRFGNYWNREEEGETFEIKLDEKLFRELYLLRLEYNNIHVKANWQEPVVKVDSVEHVMGIYRYDNEAEMYEMVILFSNYQLYLLGVISFQLIFAFILLSITAFALIFTYHSYLRQINLSVLRSDFINNITHELKIPVATAKAALEALRSFGMQADPKIMGEYLDMVANEMNRLDGLTSRVLDHSKLEKNQKNLKLESTDLGDFIEQCLKNMHILFVEKNIDVSFKMAEQDITIDIDRLYFEGVLKNLIDNSIKYGGDNTQIAIDMKTEPKQVCISISDNGPGIPENHINKVFDKFFRVPKGDQHNIKGFGLGLSFVALVIKQHGGTIKAQNNTNGGCSFTIKLPLVQ